MICLPIYPLSTHLPSLFLCLPSLSLSSSPFFFLIFFENLSFCLHHSLHQSLHQSLHRAFIRAYTVPLSPLLTPARHHFSCWVSLSLWHRSTLRAYTVSCFLFFTSAPAGCWRLSPSLH
ncbi:hypothetical protein LOK49_Contig98G00011 [Camellia lanceoleosa]|nr:hypothetical protein LOK49_Contig98G00011 [Camellia lanceoleosa]